MGAGTAVWVMSSLLGERGLIVTRVRLAIGRSASAGAAEQVEVMRGQLQVALYRGRMRIGQQRIAQGDRDEVAEFRERRGLGAGKQLSAVPLHGAGYIAGPEPVQDVGDVTAHVKVDPVRTGFQVPPEHGAQL